jgi:hypothetical protein
VTEGGDRAAGSVSAAEAARVEPDRHRRLAKMALGNAKLSTT